MHPAPLPRTRCCAGLTLAALAGLALFAGCSRTSSTDETHGADHPPVAGMAGDESAVGGAVPGEVATSTEAVAVGGGAAAPMASTATPRTGSAPSATVGAGNGGTAVAQVPIEPRSGSQVGGTVTLRETEGRLVAQVAITGLKPNAEHGFHVHEAGDCSATDASSAGPHFNPGDTPHGRPGGAQYHAGDLPNLRADANGAARIELPIPGLTLAGGETSIAGRSLVVHRDPDDFKSQPAGNSGPRIGCGVIPARR